MDMAQRMEGHHHHHHHHHGHVPGWMPDAWCDGRRAQERAEWLRENEGMGHHEAQRRVMAEFPAAFGGMGGMGGLPTMGVPAMGVPAAGGMPGMGGHQHGIMEP